MSKFSTSSKSVLFSSQMIGRISQGTQEKISESIHSSTAANFKGSLRASPISTTYASVVASRVAVQDTEHAVHVHSSLWVWLRSLSTERRLNAAWNDNSPLRDAYEKRSPITIQEPCDLVQREEVP